MDHVAFLKTLPPEVKADLTARTNVPGLRHLAVYLALLGLTSAGIALPVPGWPLLLLPQGVLLVFLFTLSHECTHQTPFRSVWLNEAVGHAIAPLLLLPFLWFRYFHLAHHRHTNDPDRDPELSGGSHPDTVRAWLIYASGWRYWSGMARVIWQNAFGRIDAPYLPPRRHRAMRIEARLLLLIYALVGASLVLSPLALWLWLVPVLIGQPILRLYLLAEHGRCAAVANMFENTRTTHTARAIRFLAWNMPYHAEHHGFPAVPFHRLPDLHDRMRAHLRQTAPGYRAFTRDYLRRLGR